MRILYYWPIKVTWQHDIITQTWSIGFERVQQWKRCLYGHLKPLPLMACRVNRSQNQRITAPASISNTQRPTFVVLLAFTWLSSCPKSPVEEESRHEPDQIKGNTIARNHKSSRSVRHPPWQVKISTFLYGCWRRDLNVVKGIGLRHIPRLKPSTELIFQNLDGLSHASQRQCWAKKLTSP